MDSFLQMKIKCLQVCERWYDITRNRFYEQLEFNSSIDKFHEACKLFKKNKHLRNNVQTVKFVDCKIAIIMLMLALHYLFPKVKHFKWLEGYKYIGVSSDAIDDQNTTTLLYFLFPHPPH